ncbi:MAG: dihydrolipoamide acetyltransferase (E2) component of pyruvate dehydrogenase complex [Nitrospira sp. OLB3]|nr:MAG: dihydrolipoamide acetyltransferase (E2) component of pyruvate dehydrogenase complex [Nitrospira sp. OLB3]
MASRVVMPKLTDTMEEGVLLAWKKQEGEPVQAGEVIAEIETDKAVMDLEAFAPGILRKVLVREGETVPSGALIAVIGEADDDLTAALNDGVTAAPLIQTKTSLVAASSTKPVAVPFTSAAGARPIASPRAKALAAERGLDLAGISGTGPGGRILEEDVLKAQADGASLLPPGVDQPLSQMRKAIARTTVQSKAPVPHFYLSTDIDMEPAERFRDRFKAQRHGHPSVTDLLIKASALALQRHPEVNVSFTGEAIRRHGQIDIGVAVGMEDGLITPVIRDCGTKPLSTISAESRALIERARQKRLQPQEYAGATFSISNLGMYDVDNFIAVLMPPQAASLAVGAIRDVPVVTKGVVTAGRRMTVTLSCDHRAIDGVQGAQFLKEVKRVLEHPQELAGSEEIS